MEWFFVEISCVSTCKNPSLLWFLYLSLAISVTECLEVIIICLFTCWKAISFWNSTRASTNYSNCGTPLHLAWKQWMHVLHAQAISTVEDRLPNIMDGQDESQSSGYDFRNSSSGTGVLQDHNKSVLSIGQCDRSFSKERIAFFSMLTAFPKDPSTIAWPSIPS